MGQGVGSLIACKITIHYRSAGKLERPQYAESVSPPTNFENQILIPVRKMPFFVTARLGDPGALHFPGIHKW